MKTFKLVFIKTSKVIGMSPKVPIMAEQTILTDDTGKIEITPPDGFVILTITEVLPPLTMITNEKKNFN